MKRQTGLLAKFTPIISFATFFPFLVYAEGVNSANDAITKITGFLGAIIPLLVAIGVVYFVWGVVQYVIADGEEAKKKGKDRIIYGIIGFALIIGLWGFVNLIVSTFSLGGQSAPDLTNLVTAPTSSAGCALGTKFQGILDYFTCIIGQSVIPFMFALAVVLFIWGAIKFFIIEASEEAKREQGKQFMLWGIIALTVMISIWGLVKIVGGTFGLQTNFLPQVKP